MVTPRFVICCCIATYGFSMVTQSVLHAIGWQ